MGLKKKLLAVSAALAMFAPPALCPAAIVPSGPTAVAFDFLGQQIAQLPASAALNPVGHESQKGAASVQAGPVWSRAPLQTPTDSAFLSLLSQINAQEGVNYFEATTAVVAASSLTVFAPSSPVSAGPLPGLTWLFVLGFLGMAGSRLTTPRGEGTPMQPLDVHVPSGQRAFPRFGAHGLRGIKS